MNILVVDAGSETAPDIAQTLRQLGCRVSMTSLQSMTAARANEHQATVVSGSPKLFSNPEETLIQYIDWIRDIHVPFLGVCFGHQALGLVHGAEIYTGPRIRGETPIRHVTPDPLLTGIASGTAFFESHTEGISVPPGFQVLGASDAYANEIMKHPEQLWFGVQFHPESTPIAGATLLRNFVTLAK